MVWEELEVILAMVGEHAKVIHAEWRWDSNPQLLSYHVALTLNKTVIHNRFNIQTLVQLIELIYKL